MDRILNVGLIGFGMAGQAFHAPIITAVPGLRLKTVVERKSSKSKEDYPWVEVVHDIEDVFKDNSIDLIVVATPNETHFDYVKQALEQGKHVVVEKPFTVTSQEAAALIQLARSKKRILSVYQNRRWDGDFLTVQQVIEQGMLGRLTEYEAHFDKYLETLRPNTWKEKSLPGSGIVYDLGSHLLDQAQMLFGIPLSVTADIRSLREGTEIEDYFEIQLGYQNSLKVTLKASMLVREPGPHFLLHGTKGSFLKYGMDPQEAALRSGRRPGEDSSWGAESESLWGKLNTEISGTHFVGKVETKPGDYRGYYRNVYEAIAGESNLQVKPEQAWITIRLIELAYKSRAEGKTIVFDEDAFQLP
ncbi:oxidoreductase [Desulfosporosinus sp. SYSU MS00001]|uniref:oxidoreductase n=1 Tax=Desulfosporosinus sp. SYSU MS00001 TaxID=3416284 RepID=UPI003CEA86F8